MHYHVNTAKDFVSACDGLPLGFSARKEKNTSEKYGSRRPSTCKAPEPDRGLPCATRKMVLIQPRPFGFLCLAGLVFSQQSLLRGR